MRLLLCFQVFDISPQQQQWLTNHLGHTLDIHKIHYRQTTGIIERVDISKLMLLTEYGLTGKYAGKTLTDITLEGNDVEFFKCFWVLFSTHQILKGIAITFYNDLILTSGKESNTVYIYIILIVFFILRLIKLFFLISEISAEIMSGPSEPLDEGIHTFQLF